MGKCGCVGGDGMGMRWQTYTFVCASTSVARHRAEGVSVVSARPFSQSERVL